MLNCIFGVDLDERAVEIAKLSLSLKLAERDKNLPMLRENIRIGNSLIENKDVAGYNAFEWEDQFEDIMKNEGFDVVIGNPPYVRMEKISESDRNYYKKRYKTVPKRFDLYSLFIEKGIELLKQSGHLGFIVPNTLLNNDDFEELRKQILEKCHLRKLNILGDGVFEGATVSTIVIILQKSKVNKDKITDVVVGKDVFSKKIIKVRQHDFYKNEKVRFNIKSEESQKIIDKCNKNSSRFEDVVDYISGIQVWQNETDRIKHPELLSKKKLNEKYKKTIIGENISKYNLKFNEDYVLYDKNLLERARDEKYFTKKEKLLMRYIGTKLICSYDNQQYYAQKSVIVLFPKNESHIPIKYLLSLINSNLFQFLYDKNVGDEPYPRINISYLLSLPIKKISLDIQQKISDVVETIISLNKKLNEIDDRNTPEKEKLQKEIQKLDKEIDELVYKIYGITEEEQKIIEESLKQ